MQTFYDRIKSHLLIPLLVARGYPLEILVLGSLTHKSPRCLQVGNGYSDTITGCASSILAGCLQRCSWARGLLFELIRALEYVVPGSVCEGHIDDLSQFVTNTNRIQLLHDAALIGKVEILDWTISMIFVSECVSFPRKINNPFWGSAFSSEKRQFLLDMKQKHTFYQRKSTKKNRKSQLF